MNGYLKERTAYSRAEYRADLIVHLAGLMSVAAAIPVLVALAVYMGNEASHIAATLVYGLGFAAMIGCSALYNIFPEGEWEWLLKRLDHSAIYLKIAGTYTAFVLIAGQGFVLAAGLWAIAVTGISLKLSCPVRWRTVGLVLYLAMGWAGVLLGWDLFASLPGAVVVLVAAGGLLYTVGVVFFLWDRLPFHNTIWHILVLVASFTIYAGLIVAIVA